MTVYATKERWRNNKMGVMNKMRDNMAGIMIFLVIVFVLTMSIGGLVGGADITDLLGGNQPNAFTLHPPQYPKPCGNMQLWFILQNAYYLSEFYILLVCSIFTAHPKNDTLNINIVGGKELKRYAK